MKKFEVKKELTTITNRHGVTLRDVENSLFDCDNREPETLGSFDLLSAATTFYDSIQPHTISHRDGKTFVCEYIYIEENEYDEDGEFVSGGDVYFGKTKEITKEED